jgi:hypothetical protein
LPSEHPAGGFALKVQLLPRQLQQVLVIAGVLAARQGNRRFTTAHVSKLFFDLRLPSPVNVSDVLGVLRKRDLVLRDPGNGTWTLTPLGEAEVLKLLKELDYEQVGAELVGSPGAQLALVTHPLIGPEFAPPKWSAGIARLLERFPFDNNIFCMTRFPSEDPQHKASDLISDVVAEIKATAMQHGMAVHLASDRQLEDDLLANVAAYLWACKYGIGLVENRVDRGLNYNAVIEVGAMLVTGRRCAILRDTTAPDLPTDLSGQIYKSVNFSDLPTVRDATHRWLAEDLGLGRCEHCPS